MSFDSRVVVENVSISSAATPNQCQVELRKEGIGREEMNVPKPAGPRFCHVDRDTLQLVSE
jgi:hypothetical protein